MAFSEAVGSCVGKCHRTRHECGRMFTENALKLAENGHLERGCKVGQGICSAELFSG